MIVADSGPLIVLARLKLLKVLTQLFKEVWLPEQVYEECTVSQRLPGASVIQKAVLAGQLKLQTIPELHPAFADPYLGRSERAAMSLALMNNAMILVDDRRARLIAERQNLQVIGTAGVLLATKQNELIKKISPFLVQLENFQYYFSVALKKELLKRANED